MGEMHPLLEVVTKRITATAITLKVILYVPTPPSFGHPEWIEPDLRIDLGRHATAPNFSNYAAWMSRSGP